MSDKGAPLRDGKGKDIPLPDNRMVCPRCGNTNVEKRAEGDKSPTGLPIYYCGECRIEFTQNLKKSYCHQFGVILPENCGRCSVFQDLMRIAANTGADLRTLRCPHFKGNMGEHFVPEGWQSDAGADDNWGKTRWRAKKL